MADKYLDKLVTFTPQSKSELNKLYKAVLRAAQYDAFQYQGQAFHLLEGVVRKNSKGEYIFTPNKHLQEMLEKAGCPSLLKIEESRFVDLIKIGLEDIKEANDRK